MWILAVINTEPKKKNYLEAIFELLGDKVEDYGIDAGVDCCHVDAKVVKYQQKTAATEGHIELKSVAKKDEEREAI